MFEAYGQALTFLFQPMSLLMMLGAVLLGLIVGITPGIGAILVIALLLPFLFRMPAEIALTFLIALSAVTPTGGSITSILLNIPGTGANIATAIDGFPMNQKGEGARAIGAAVSASSFGGLVPVFLAMLTIPLVLPIVMAFKSPEMAVLVLVGISFIAVLTGRSAIKGLISGALGVLLASIGVQGVTGVERFTFGRMFLYDGLGMIPVILGIFGLAELFDMSIKGQRTIASVAVSAKLADVFQGLKDVFTHKWLWFRSTLIGYIVGVIPGIGAETGIFVAYAQAKQTAKEPEKFGTGCVEGVIAPESANNAVVAGALLTTMAFGIPGSVVMAVFMGAFLMVGVIPGPRMLIDHLPLGLTLLIGIALANVFGGLICFFTAPYLARVATVNFTFLFPVILSLVFVGAFAVRNSVLDIMVVIIFGVLGLLIKMYDFSRPALLLGFILGRLLEDYILLSIQVAGPLFFMTPISLVLFVLLIGMFTYPYLRKVLAEWWQSRLKKT